MFMFGGWDYEGILAMVDDLVYGRRYGGFYDIITNFTVRELVEIFNVITNKENKKNLQDTVSQSNNELSVPTEELSQEMIDFLMNG